MVRLRSASKPDTISRSSSCFARGGQVAFSPQLVRGAGFEDVTSVYSDVGLRADPCNG